MGCRLIGCLACHWIPVKDYQNSVAGKWLTVHDLHAFSFTYLNQNRRRNYILKNQEHTHCQTFPNGCWPVVFLHLYSWKEVTTYECYTVHHILPLFTIAYFSNCHFNIQFIYEWGRHDVFGPVIHHWIDRPIPCLLFYRQYYWLYKLTVII